MVKYGDNGEDSAVWDSSGEELLIMVNFWLRFMVVNLGLMTNSLSGMF